MSRLPSGLVIRTEKLEATDEQPTRIRALVSNSTTEAGAVVPYDHSLSLYANHERAFRALCAKLATVVGSKWVGSPFEHGYLFLRVFNAPPGNQHPMAHDLITITKEEPDAAGR